MLVYIICGALPGKLGTMSLPGLPVTTCVSSPASCSQRSHLEMKALKQEMLKSFPTPEFQETIIEIPVYLRRYSHVGVHGDKLTHEHELYLIRITLCVVFSIVGYCRCQMHICLRAK